jgi:hypothetical protein
MSQSNCLWAWGTYGQHRTWFTGHGLQGIQGYFGVMCRSTVLTFQDYFYMRASLCRLNDSHETLGGGLLPPTYEQESPKSHYIR